MALIRACQQSAANFLPAHRPHRGINPIFAMFA